MNKKKLLDVLGLIFTIMINVIYVIEIVFFLILLLRTYNSSIDGDHAEYQIAILIFTRAMLFFVICSSFALLIINIVPLILYKRNMYNYHIVMSCILLYESLPFLLSGIKTYPVLVILGGTLIILICVASLIVHILREKEAQIKSKTPDDVIQNVYEV